MQVHIQNDGPVTIELESPVVEAKSMKTKNLPPEKESLTGDDSADK